MTLPRTKTRDFANVIFNDRFNRFIQNILNEPSKVHVYEVKTPEADLGISFNPRQHGVTGMHANYTFPYSRTRNPLARALKSKIGQLKQSGFRGPLGIVVCDGDCYMLRSSMVGRWHGSSYAPQDVVREFFRRYSSLSFVLVLTIEERLKWVAGLGNLEYRHQLFVNRSARQKVPERIIECLEQLPKFLPTPMRTPMNARHHLDWQRRTRKWFGYGSIEGGMIMTDSTVKVSARPILDLLSRKQGPEVFFRLHRLDDFNPFEVMQREGRLIKNVRVEKSDFPEDDDEWLVFEFGDVDAAISPYRFPDLR